MLRSHRKSTESRHPAMRPSTSPVRSDSNSTVQAEVDAENSPVGPFDSPVLNAALSEAFADNLGSLRASWADDACEQVGARAMTQNHTMTFASPIQEECEDSDSMAVVGEEVAHALAGSGTGQTFLDGPSDPGEGRAKDAGQRFAAWADQDFVGEAPDLRPAAGGRAEVHRNAATVLTGRPALRLGARGSEVHLLQSLLNHHGAGVVVDGDFGRQTDGAVRRFQLARGLIVDGVVGPQTAGALNQGSAASTTPAELTGSPALRLASTGEAVRVCQERLNAHGANVTVDGRFGAQTDEAVRRFQISKGLTVDGIVGPTTAGALNAAPAPDSAELGAGTLTGSPALRRGSQGEQVRILQGLLTEAGFRCLVDGDFGSATERQVRSYQSSRGLMADGVVGLQTATALREGRPAVSGAAPTGPAQPRDFDPQNRLAHAKCSPGNRRAAVETAERITAAGYQPYIVSVYRTFSEQDAAYAQGRTEPGPRVTGVRGGGSWHNYGCAVDFAFWNDRHTSPSWASHHPWHLIGQCGMQAGYTKWGGDWGDRPHLELHPQYSASAYNLVSLYQSAGIESVWDRVGAR